MMEAARAIDVLRQAAQLNREDPLLGGSLLSFPDYGQVVMTGDLHGHRRNFERIRKFCNLENFGARHVVLHELVHVEPVGIHDLDLSFELVLEAAGWKCDFPDQVHFLLSNHELAQIKGAEISKNGRIVTRDFETAVEKSYADNAGEVLSAMYDFIETYPLAGRTANRVLLSHSLPGPRDATFFDPSVFARKPIAADVSDRGSAHMLIWGRYQTPAVLQHMSDLLQVDFFLCGHQPQESGFNVLHERMVIMASDHNHGVFLPLDLSKSVSIESLRRAIRPLAAIA